MTTRVHFFDVTQNRGWRGDRRFRIWVAGGTFRGALLHENGVVENTGGFLGAVVPALDIVGALMLIVLLPLALVWNAIIGRKERRKKERLDALSPQSDDFLAWDEPNFRLDASHIASAEFFEKPAFLSWWIPANKLDLHLSNGRKWNFSFKTRVDADQLRRELSESGIATTWREKAV